ncbi:MAG: nucleotidyl transferase AbiEii/AbiGii toxin family protein [Verrucomicrobiales bacterium]|nr:nucleotidyl transferase AbiEii/AbiGii toxin family protein [Verrucomicrobiales bacterium]
MTEELVVLRDITIRLESAGIDYMLTGSVALACHAQPRMTRDIDLVVAFDLKDAGRIAEVLGADYYVSAEAAREAVVHQSSFNAIHESTLIKVDFMVRKREDYRLNEFTRRMRMKVADFDLWVVSKEDLILSKLDWARESHSERQLADVENLIATGCDVAYLHTWSAALHLTDMLTRVLP